MPSLSELEKFKASFQHVGNQKSDLAARNIPLDDLPLPDSEPEPLPVPEEPVAPPDSDEIDFDDITQDTETEDDIDFSAFLDSQPEDLPEPPTAEIPVTDVPIADIPVEDTPSADTPAAEELYAPEGLLSNLSEELDAIPPDFPEEPPAISAGRPLDLDSLDNFDFPDEPLSVSEEEIPETINLGDMTTPEGLTASNGESLDLDNLDLGLPGEVTASNGESLDLDNLDLDLPGETASTDGGDESLDLDNLDLGLPGDVTASNGESLDLDNLDLGLPGELESGESLDLDNLGDLDLPEEAASTDGGDDSLDLDNLDLGLPGEVESGESLDLDNLGDLDLPEEAALTDGGDESLDLDNLDLGLPGDVESGESLDLDNLGDLDLPGEAADGEESLDLDNLGDLDLPGEAADSETHLDLDNLGDLDLPGEAASTSGDESLDLDNLGDLDLPGEAASTDSEESLDLDNLGDLDLPGEATDGDESLDLDNLGDLSLPDDLSVSDDSGLSDTGLDLPEATADGGDESLDLDNLGGLDLPGEAADGDESLDLDNLGGLDDFDIPEGTDSADGDDTPLDLGNLDDSVLDGEQGSDKISSDDFSFPELDNVLKKSTKPTKAAEPPKTRKKLRGKDRKQKIEAAIHDNVDEIQLSDDEFEGLQETLSRYPLNLRIACEEIIAEQFIDPKLMSELIEHLVWGASAKETAVLAGRILGRTITIPKAFEKSTGAALEAEQASFAYIFVHSFLPVLRLVVFIGLVVFSLLYLLYTFVYIPNEAEKLYKRGYERIFAGEYQRANEHFNDAFYNYSRKKNWFYKYAEAFRDERQYIYAEQKYDELLRHYPRDKKGVLDYANLETYYLRNYEKADEKLRHQLLDYNPNDIDGLLAAGDNYLLWGEIDPSQYEKARFNYARVLELKGWQAPVVERMMKYFIRTDNLREVLPLKDWFDNDPQKRVLSAESLGELGGYLLDKQLEDVKGVPNEFVEYIGSVREMLLKAIYADASLPEPHYHLARYYHNLGNAHEELVTLRIANRAFDEAPEGSLRRINYRIDALQRYADALTNAREFFPAEEQLIKGINLYEDAVSRRLISPSPQYGRLYAGLGDLEYFTKTGDMEAALRYYHRSEQYGWMTPDIQYRMGAAYYRLENWKGALEYFFNASNSLPQNRRVLFALGNSALKRGDYFAANGYYNRLLNILETQRSRLPILLPNDRPEYLELADRLMMAQNNAGVANEMLAAQTGNRTYHSRALGFYSESNRAWDARTRDPRSMIRGSISPASLNIKYALYPEPNYEHKIFIHIDWEAREDSLWEALNPGPSLSARMNNQ